MARFPVRAPLALIAVFAQAFAQPTLEQATLAADPGAPGGKCAIEIILNGSAEIDLLGPTGNLRSLTGKPLGWRRFECTSVLPPNPDGFQIHLTSGRGRLELLRHPLIDGGGPASFRVKSSQPFPEVFVVEIFWTGTFDLTFRSLRPRS
jgi:hypothetical protein